jgi:hypothetical protein
MTSSMVMGSVLLMEEVGLSLARNVVQRYALETGSEHGKADDTFARWAMARHLVARLSLSEILTSVGLTETLFFGSTMLRYSKSSPRFSHWIGASGL